MENRQKQVINYYLLCNKLKTVIRTGWLNWKVDAKRVESIAEHIYGTQMMAIAMCKAYNYDIDLLKVSLMLAVHETEEIIIGDKTLFQISKEDKEIEGHKAIHYIFSDILSAPELEQLILEFDERKTKEAYFAYQCDKIECDVQAKIYGDKKYVDLNHQEGNKTAQDPRVTEWFNKGYDFGEMWILFGQKRYGYDKNFLEVSNYALNNNLNQNQLNKDSRAKQVIEYYLLCNKLKNIIRTGWLTWNVDAQRVESIAEHIFSVQMLAIGMFYSYGYDIDLLKTSLMLAIHETEEIIIGDKTLFQISDQDKAITGHQAVHHIFGEILSAPALEQLILEFDERKTKDADFAFHCDKLDWGLQSKLYGDKGNVDLTKQDNNPVSRHPSVTKWFDKGYDFGQMCLKFDQERYGYDHNFTEVSDYAFENNLAKEQNTLKK